MAEIKKLDLYLNDKQYKKLCSLAEQKGVSPEHAANDALYGYLAVIDPFAPDYDDLSPEQQTEADKRYIEWCVAEGLNPYKDDAELLSTAYYDSEEGNELLQYDTLDPNVELDEDGYRK